MNNKKRGSEFEKRICEWLASRGYWVHFIVPDARGAQPFDIIAVKDGRALALDCKTCVADAFNINRLEDNQVMAFERWLRCGNKMPYIAVYHAHELYMIPYDQLKKYKSIRLGREYLVNEGFND